MKIPFARPLFRAVALASFGGGVAVVLMPLALAAEDGPRVIRAFPAPDAAAPKRDGGTLSKIPPDPSPMVERKQWVFDLRYDKGDLFFVGVHPVDLGSPQATPRAMGRFAIELFEGPTLIERVRFDFPFLGAGDDAPDGGNRFNAPPRFEGKVTTRIGVMFPATTRGTRLELWDRKTDQRWPLPWPPPEAARTVGDAG